MPKIRVSYDERYPDYYIVSDNWAPQIEVTDEELAFIKQADENYKKAQGILARVRKK
jgi:hypothetical protein